jgi:uncharacterized membrane protein HdeD (DUF308 family)
MRQGDDMLRTEIHMAALRRTWWALVIRGVLAVAIGGFIIARPLASVAALALLIAVWALVQGVVDLVHAAELRGAVPHWWLLVVSGVIGVGFGAAALYDYPALSLAFAVVWTAWWLLLGGAVSIGIALQARRAGMPWGWTLGWGIGGVVAGVAGFANPPATLVALMSLLSAFAIVSGVALLFAAYGLRHARHVAATVRMASSG